MLQKFFAFLLCVPASISFYPYLRQQKSTATRPRQLIVTKQSTSDPLIHPRYYWPNYGYEPYWADGNWALEDPAKKLKPNQTTTKIPIVCGEECSFVHMRIKEVCGHKSSTFKYYWCWGLECKGEVLKDVFPYHFKTFDTYCEFLAEQCKSDVYRWGLVHVGRCVEYKQQHTFLKPLMPQPVLVSRMQSYLSTWQWRIDRLLESKGGTTKKAHTTMSTPGAGK